MGDRRSILGFSYAYTLNTSQTLTTINSNVVSITLSQLDLDSLKAARIGSYLHSTFIRLSNFTVEDVSGNLNQATAIASELQVSILTPDMRSPALSSYDLDLNSGLISFTFTETVSAGTFTPAALTIQSDMFGFGSSLPITEGTLLDSDSPNVRLLLTTNDLNRLKISPVARSVISTYLSFPSSLVLDSFANPISPIQPTSALNVNTYIADSTRPEVCSFPLTYHEISHSCEVPVLLGDNVLTGSPSSDPHSHLQ